MQSKGEKIEMNRLEIFTKLQELETTKTELNNLLDDVSDYYCKGVEIAAVLDTNTFESKRKYAEGNRISLNKSRFADFLKLEIKGIDSEISTLLGKLQEV
jgi:chaperonin cofactor prefoldin